MGSVELTITKMGDKVNIQIGSNQTALQLFMQNAQEFKIQLNNVAGLTLGTIVSFLNLTRGFNMPIQQVSNQLNAVTMALAGASRIFEMMDEEKEVDDGYVTLVNAKREDGKLIHDHEIVKNVEDELKVKKLEIKYN